jgi:hypothetical protein
MNKPILAAATALLAVSILAADKIKIAPEHKVGSKQKLSLDMTLSLSGADAQVNALVTTEVKKNEGKDLQQNAVWSNLKVTLNGEDFPITASDMTVTQSGGALQDVTGGLMGTDPIRTYLLVHFPMPPKELAKDETWTSTFPATKAGVPEHKYDVTYLGAEDGAHKFLVKLEEIKGEQLKSEAKFWVTEKGEIKKQEGKFSNLPIPQAGMSADGMVRLAAKE